MTKTDAEFLAYLHKLAGDLHSTSNNCIDLTKEMQYEYAGCIVDSIISRYTAVFPYD